MTGTILVGVDGSECGRLAIEAASALCVALGARMRLVHVRRPTMVAIEAQPQLAHALETQSEAESKELLENARAQATVPEEQVETSSVSGNAADQLTQLAAESDVTMVVVGSHGRGAMGRLLLGSVAASLVRTSPRPVLVVRSN